MITLGSTSALLIAAALFGTCSTQTNAPNQPAGKRAVAALRVRIEASPTLPLHCDPYVVKPPVAGWESGAVSGVAVGTDGKVYEIQRGTKSAPVLVLDREGRVLHSWGQGKYQIPHSIRLDPGGNVWTVDAASSIIIKYSADGQQLMTLDVGGQPNNGSTFNGTTDIGFEPDGNFFIADGYGNARIVEYASDGKEIRQWGRPGSGPGEFDLPHSLQIGNGTLYVADRENGRIEKFDFNGRYLDQIPNLGRIYSLKLMGNVIWASMGPFDQAPGAAGVWVLKLDSRTGEIIGHIDIPGSRAGHALDVTPSGEPIITSGNELLWCKAD